MFDDQMNNGNSGQLPPNLPVGEPEDIFKGGDQNPEVVENAPIDTPQNVPEVNPGVPGSALDAGVLKPKSEPVTDLPPVVKPEAKPENIPPIQANYSALEKEPKMSRGLMIVLVLVVGIGLTAGAVYAAYNWFIASDSEAPTNTAPIQNTDPTPVVPDSGEGIPDLSDQEIDSSLLFGEPIDRDGDGLDDVREAGIGTDSKNWDSDADGLSDGDEVIIWKTEPMNPDTDADGYSDGSEVKSGYSPTGAGRLFEPPAEIK